jgi:hypothetical protein
MDDYDCDEPVLVVYADGCRAGYATAEELRALGVMADDGNPHGE